jgi:hypothetical protein
VPTVPIIDMENGSIATPLLSMRSAAGDEAHAIKDDHCVVLVIKGERGFKMSPWWFREFLDAVKEADL